MPPKMQLSRLHAASLSMMYFDLVERRLANFKLGVLRKDGPTVQIWVPSKMGILSRKGLIATGHTRNKSYRTPTLSCLGSRK